MKTLELNQMESINGGVSWLAFGCGFGIVASVMVPGMALVVGEATVIACASLVL